ncbi:MAG: hypothetical protein E6J74_30625 [Deltaproteobacteria bacterium]|nr:MAG: hypothetical protein E6J74_30625 [Deltaproteobacteria bacterium]
MADLTIPERHRNGVVKLLELSEDSFSQMVSALEGVGPKLFPDNLSSQMISKIKGVSPEDVSEIITTIMSLSSHRMHDDSTAEELAEQVVQAAIEANIPIKSDKERITFKDRLLKFFELNTLFVSAKALGILLSNENLFCSARILTDIRPVFGTDPTVAPTAIVMVHMLDLGYHKDGELKHLYIAMDSIDIDTLREALNRAEMKAESLKPLMKKAGVEFLDPSE